MDIRPFTQEDTEFCSLGSYLYFVKYLFFLGTRLAYSNKKHLFVTTTTFRKKVYIFRKSIYTYALYLGIYTMMKVYKLVQES